MTNPYTKGFTSSFIKGAVIAAVAVILFFASFNAFAQVSDGSVPALCSNVEQVMSEVSSGDIEIVSVDKAMIPQKDGVIQIQKLEGILTTKTKEKLRGIWLVDRAGTACLVSIVPLGKQHSM